MKMKKIRVLLLFICLITLFTLAFTSCGIRLSKPSGLHIDDDTQTLKWNRVKGAQGYTVEIVELGIEVVTQANYYSLEKLEPGVYDIRVYANGDGKTTRNSSVAKFNDFKREKESGLKYQLINNGTEYALVGGGTADGDVVMESIYRNKPVTAIADKALYHNAKITSFTIGANVKTIGAKAFTKCSKLTEIVVPENVTSIGEYAFQSCKALKKVTLPSSVSTIAPYTFAWCSALEEIEVGNKLTLIDEYAFSNCEKLTTISYTGLEATNGKAQLPDTLLAISGYAFADCLGLADISFGKGIQSIGMYAFSNNFALKNLNLGESLVELQDGVFYGCAALTGVSLPNTTELLGNGVFYGCTLLNEVSLGTGIKADRKSVV